MSEPAVKPKQEGFEDFGHSPYITGVIVDMDKGEADHVFGELIAQRLGHMETEGLELNNIDFKDGQVRLTYTERKTP